MKVGGSRDTPQDTSVVQAQRVHSVHILQRYLFASTLNCANEGRQHEPTIKFQEEEEVFVNTVTTPSVKVQIKRLIASRISSSSLVFKPFVWTMRRPFQGVVLKHHRVSVVCRPWCSCFFHTVEASHGDVCGRHTFRHAASPARP